MTLISLYSDINDHILHDDRPSIYFNDIYSDPQFRKYPFLMLYKLKGTKQSPKHHPEGDVWSHTMLVIDEAARVKSQSKDYTVFMWAALLHDIGEPNTTKVRNGKVTAYNHEKVGAEFSKKILGEFTNNSNFINKVFNLIQYHMQILFVVRDLPFADIPGMIRDTDINEVALLGLCDRLGRTNKEHAREEENIRLFLQKCKQN